MVSEARHHEAKRLLVPVQELARQLRHGLLTDPTEAIARFNVLARAWGYPAYKSGELDSVFAESLDILLLELEDVVNPLVH